MQLALGLQGGKHLAQRILSQRFLNVHRVRRTSGSLGIFTQAQIFMDWDPEDRGIALGRDNLPKGLGVRARPCSSSASLAPGNFSVDLDVTKTNQSL